VTARPPGLQTALNQLQLNAGASMPNYDRVTCSGYIHFERVGSDPISAQGQYVSLISGGGEEPYQRTMRIQELWKPLDLGWFLQNENTGPGLVFIENRTDRQQVNSGAPPQLLETILKKELLIRLDGASDNWIHLKPGEFFWLRCTDWRQVNVRAADGVEEVQLFLVAFPR
jgi:hypothetical protein